MRNRYRVSEYTDFSLGDGLPYCRWVVREGNGTPIRGAWCDRESEDPPWFNCEICELQMDDGRCGLKTFINNEHYPMEYPQGEDIVHSCHCTNCGAEIEYYVSLEETEE